jgi:hypothetical protein
MNPKPKVRFNNNKIQISSLFGLMLVIAGLLTIIELQIKTGWITIAIPGLMGIILLIYGLLSAKKGWLIAGSLVTGIGLGVFFALQQFRDISLIHRFGYLTMFFAASWVIAFFLLRFIYQNTAWWALLCGSIFGGAGYTLLFASDYTIFYFILSITLPMGVVFLLWGLRRKLLGLIITGSLVTTTGLGIFMAWNHVAKPQGLMETGVMLVWFSLGWFLVTIFSRIIYKKFVWWPLIPGGVLAMVGWGLYIGGNPGNALDFVGNSGSIGLIIFGVYLLLLRFGMQKSE